jgi:hypothetical protein
VFVLEAGQAYDPVSPIGHTVIEVRTEVMCSLCQIWSSSAALPP